MAVTNAICRKVKLPASIRLPLQSTNRYSAVSLPSKSEMKNTVPLGRGRPNMKEAWSPGALPIENWETRVVLLTPMFAGSAVGLGKDAPGYRLKVSPAFALGEVFVAVNVRPAREIPLSEAPGAIFITLEEGVEVYLVNAQFAK